MKQGGWTKSLGLSLGLAVSPISTGCFPVPIDPKGRLANFSQAFFLPPERTSHSRLSGNGRIMIKSSAGLTKPYYAGSVSYFSVAALLTTFYLQVTWNSLIYKHLLPSSPPFSIISCMAARVLITPHLY